MYINNIIRSVFLALCGMVFLVTLYDKSFAVEEIDAKEIMAKSNSAMNQPIRYTIVNDKLKTTVYRKMQPDGSYAILRDVVSNNTSFQRTTISSGCKEYEIYFDKGIAIDVAFRSLTRRKIAFDVEQKVLAHKNEESSQKILRGKYKPVETVEMNGRLCYKIEYMIPQKTIDALVISFPYLAAVERYIIDKETFLKLSHASLTGDGKILSSMDYRDIVLQPDLTDDFFELPPGLEVKTPASEKEYREMYKEIALSRIVPKRLASPIPNTSSSRVLRVVAVNLVFLLLIIGLILYRKRK